MGNAIFLLTGFIVHNGVHGDITNVIYSANEMQHH